MRLTKHLSEKGEIMNQKKIKKCPACGYDKPRIKKVDNKGEAPYGPEISVQEMILTCENCEAEFDYGDLIGEESKSPYEISKSESIDFMIRLLKDISGYSLASIERALELPQRTFSRWLLHKEFSSASIAMLRILCTYPWIIEVAENKFREDYARLIHMRTGIGEFLDLIRLNDLTQSLEKKPVRWATVITENQIMAKEAKPMLPEGATTDTGSMEFYERT